MTYDRTRILPPDLNNYDSGPGAPNGYNWDLLKKHMGSVIAWKGPQDPNEPDVTCWLMPGVSTLNYADRVSVYGSPYTDLAMRTPEMNALIERLPIQQSRDVDPNTSVDPYGFFPILMRHKQQHGGPGLPDAIGISSKLGYGVQPYIEYVGSYPYTQILHTPFEPGKFLYDDIEQPTWFTSQTHPELLNCGFGDGRFPTYIQNDYTPTIPSTVGSFLAYNYEGAATDRFQYQHYASAAGFAPWANTVLDDDGSLAGGMTHNWYGTTEHYFFIVGGVPESGSYIRFVPPDFDRFVPDSDGSSSNLGDGRGGRLWGIGEEEANRQSGSLELSGYQTLSGKSNVTLTFPAPLPTYWGTVRAAWSVPTQQGSWTCDSQYHVMGIIDDSVYLMWEYFAWQVIYRVKLKNAEIAAKGSWYGWGWLGLGNWTGLNYTYPGGFNYFTEGKPVYNYAVNAGPWTDQDEDADGNPIGPEFQFPNTPFLVEEELIKPPYLRIKERDDGLGANSHPRLDKASSQEEATAPRVGGKSTYF